MGLVSALLGDASIPDVPGQDAGWEIHNRVLPHALWRPWPDAPPPRTPGSYARSTPRSDPSPDTPRQQETPTREFWLNRRFQSKRPRPRKPAARASLAPRGVGASATTGDSARLHPRCATSLVRVMAPHAGDTMQFGTCLKRQTETRTEQRCGRRRAGRWSSPGHSVRKSHASIGFAAGVSLWDDRTTSRPPQRSTAREHCGERDRSLRCGPRSVFTRRIRCGVRASVPSPWFAT